MNPRRRTELQAKWLPAAALPPRPYDASVRGPSLPLWATNSLSPRAEVLQDNSKNFAMGFSNEVTKKEKSLKMLLTLNYACT